METRDLYRDLIHIHDTRHPRNYSVPHPQHHTNKNLQTLCTIPRESRKTTLMANYRVRPNDLPRILTIESFSSYFIVPKQLDQARRATPLGQIALRLCQPAVTANQRMAHNALFKFYSPGGELSPPQIPYSRGPFGVVFRLLQRSCCWSRAKYSLFVSKRKASSVISVIPPMGA